jgi:hypothetical protein
MADPLPDRVLEVDRVCGASRVLAMECTTPPGDSDMVHLANVTLLVFYRQNTI